MLSASSHVNLHHVLGSLRSVVVPSTPGAAPHVPWPFLTISRQAGAGGHTLGTALAQRLNSLEFTGSRVRSLPDHDEELAHPWQCLDRELVERIAKDQHLSERLVESLQKSSHTWISEFFSSLSLTDNEPSEMAVFRRVVQDMRAMAQAGHVILIGLGGVFMTRDMPAGIHIRLVAPLEYRIKGMAHYRQMSDAEARRLVHSLDEARNLFFYRYWPHQPFTSELFHLTLNSSLISEEKMVDCILPLLKPLMHAARS